MECDFDTISDFFSSEQGPARDSRCSAVHPAGVARDGQDGMPRWPRAACSDPSLPRMA